MWLISKSSLVKRRVQEVAGTVAGEHASGSIRTVRARRQAQQEQLGVPVAKSRNPPTPVSPAAVGPPFFACHLFPMRDQARAFAAGDNLFRQYQERRRLVVQAFAFNSLHSTTA